VAAQPLGDCCQGHMGERISRGRSSTSGDGRLVERQQTVVVVASHQRICCVYCDLLECRPPAEPFSGRDISDDDTLILNGVDRPTQ